MKPPNILKLNKQKHDILLLKLPPVYFIFIIFIHSMDIPEIISLTLKNFDTWNSDDRWQLAQCSCVNMLWFNEAIRIIWHEQRDVKFFIHLAKVDDPKRQQLYASCLQKVSKGFFEHLLRFSMLIGLKFDSVGVLFLPRTGLSDANLLRITSDFSNLKAITLHSGSIKKTGKEIHPTALYQFINLHPFLQAITIRGHEMPDLKQMIILFSAEHCSITSLDFVAYKDPLTYMNTINPPHCWMDIKPDYFGLKEEAEGVPMKLSNSNYHPFENLKYLKGVTRNEMFSICNAVGKLPQLEKLAVLHKSSRPVGDDFIKLLRHSCPMLKNYDRAGPKSTVTSTL